MDSIVKTILYCYPYFEEVAEGIKELAYYKAVSSHSNAFKTLRQIERVMNLYEDAKFLRRLKRFVNQALENLTEYEKTIVISKYFKREKAQFINKSVRTYYRQQQKAFEKIVNFAKQNGVSYQWFMKNCYHLHCMRNVYKGIIKRKAQKNAIANDKTLSVKINPKQRVTAVNKQKLVA